MRQIETIKELRSIVREWKLNGETVGFVPTMGFLHKGHLSLVEEARQKTDHVIMSIFVNPLQFGPNEDFDQYPRDLEHDRNLAEQVGVDVLFTPTVAEMYPVQMQTFVSVNGITDVLCGASRPGHFTGVATVVTKLFQIVQPEKAFFGQKDFQQIAVIKTFVRDLNIPVEIVPCPIVREEDGLALSSRNVYLSESERKQALVLNKSLRLAQELVNAGETNVQKLRDTLIQKIKDQSLANIDYVEIRDPNTLEEIDEIDSEGFLALAVRFGKTRLIDNCVLKTS